MALNFPSAPVLNQTYQRWTWNGTAWVPTPTVSVPQLPISGGVLTGNLGVQGTTALDGTLTAAGLSNLNTVQVNGQADFLDGVTLDGVDSADLATKTYVDEAVASGGLWQGTWDAAANNPDLTDPDLHMNGWGWTIVTPDPTAPFDIPATPAIPGVSGATVYNGDHVIWSAAASTFEIVHGSSLSLQEAQGMFLSLDNGGTVDGNTTFSADVTIPASGTLTVHGHSVALQPAAATPTTMTQAGAGSAVNNCRLFAFNIDCSDPNAQLFTLQSSDVVKMWFMVTFNLNNVTGPFRKVIAFDTTRLYQGQVGYGLIPTAAWQGYVRYDRGWPFAIPIFVNGGADPDNEWRHSGASIPFDHSTGMYGWADFNGRAAVKHYWQRRNFSGGNTETVTRYTMRNRALWEMTGAWRNFNLRQSGMLNVTQTSSMAGVVENFGTFPATMIRVTLDYYSPTFKFAAWEIMRTGFQYNT